MLDWKLVQEAFERYEEIKAAIPALEASFKSITTSVAKVQEVFQREQKNLQDLLGQKAALVLELQKQKDVFLAELKVAKEEAIKVKEEATKILNTAKLKEDEVEKKNQEVNLLKVNLNKQAEDIQGKRNLLKDLLNKLG